ncbi:MAG: tetratricopeptide repeat protein [Bacteroidota bacterium]
MVIVFLLAFLPSVLLYTYFHNKGNQEWNRLERYVIPSNLLVAVLVLVLMFAGRDLSAKDEKITIVNEEGQTLERTVPKKEFIKRFLFLPAQVDTPDNNWMKIALPTLVKNDLEQDNRLYGVSAISLYTSIKRYGYQFGQKLPSSIQRKIANNRYCDFVIGTNIDYNEGMYKITFLVNDAKTGSSFFEQSYKDPNFYAIVDQFTVDIRKQLYPDQKLTTIDLPSEEILSANEEALQAFAESYAADDFENDKQKALDKINKAIAKDPAFVGGYLKRAGVYQSLRKKEEMNANIELAMQYVDVLPERMQLNVKYFYFLFVEDNEEKAMALLEMWKDLYPQDITPFSRLMSLNQNGLNYKKAKAYAEEALEVGHTNWILLRLAFLNRKEGNMEDAEGYYLRFMEEFPELADETYGLGYLYKDQGEFDKAKAHFEKIQLVEPNSYEIYGSLAEIEMHMLDFDAAKDYYDQALQKAKLPEDSATVFQWVEDFYQAQGQIEKALELMEFRMQQLEPQYLTVAELFDELTWADTYSLYNDCGRLDEIHQRTKAYLAKYIPDNKLQGCMTDFFAGLFDEDKSVLIEAFERCGDIYMEKSSENERVLGKAFYAKASGKYEESIAYFERICKEVPGSFFKLELSELYLITKQPAKVKELLEPVAKINPFEGKLAIELAKAEEALGDKEKAQEWVDQALMVWSNADECFRPKQEAIALQQKISAL